MRIEHSELEKIYIKIINTKIKAMQDMDGLEVVHIGSGIEVHKDGVAIPITDINVSGCLSIAHNQTKVEIDNLISELLEKIK